jgi:hypothetical protein
VVALCSAAEVSPAVLAAFAHAPADKAYLYPLTVGGTTAGMLSSNCANAPASGRLPRRLTWCGLNLPPVPRPTPQPIGTI